MERITPDAFRSKLVQVIADLLIKNYMGFTQFMELIVRATPQQDHDRLLTLIPSPDTEFEQEEVVSVIERLVAHLNTYELATMMELFFAELGVHLLDGATQTLKAAFHIREALPLLRDEG